MFVCSLDNKVFFHRAALYNKVDVIRLLAGNVCIVQLTIYIPVAMLSSNRLSGKTAKWAIFQSADLNAKDKKNKSPLHCACWKGQTETAQYLIDMSAQVPSRYFNLS